MIIVKLAPLEGLVPRMLELVSRATPWHRRDWRAGTLELVEEAIVDLQIPGTSGEAQKELKRQAARAVGKDPAVTASQKELINCISKIGPESGPDSYFVRLAEHHARDLKNGYLKNWSNIFEDTSLAGALDVEGTAKRIISHILYCGVHASSVYSVIEDRHKSNEEYSFSSVLGELDDRVWAQPKVYTFVVPVDKQPDFLHEDRPGEGGWMTAKQLKQWKHKHAPQASKVRHHGGFTLSVESSDVNSAATEIQRQLSQLGFKFRAGSGNGFSILDSMWSKEKHAAFPTRRHSHPMKLNAFERAGAVEDRSIDARTRNILAIIEPLQTNDSHVAVVHGWVAIESLLVGAGEPDSIGAERMARVVAASYFRSELTWLARSYARHYEGKSMEAEEIARADVSVERVRLMKSLIESSADLTGLSEVDQLAVDKMRTALREPKRTFDRTQEILQGEFLRMYRKRNLVVHSGRAVEVGIESLAGKIVPLLVNGIDQILIASLQFGLDPKALAAAIEFNVLHLRNPSDSSRAQIFDLLEEEWIATAGTPRSVVEVDSTEPGI